MKITVDLSYVGCKKKIESHIENVFALLDLYYLLPRC